MNTLGQIVARTRETLALKKSRTPLEAVVGSAQTPGPRRSFASALTRPGGVRIIAEFKRRSPSRGVLRQDLPVVKAAQAYEIAGAAALSVLTEEHFFGGSLEDLSKARSATLLPVLRKDFIVDPYQIFEAAAAGADAVLLITAVLGPKELTSLRTTAREVGLDALVEVHSREELERALEAGAEILGVNNRDLNTMEVSLETALSLAPFIPEDRIAVAESGIHSGMDLRRLADAGYDAFLVGEHLMRARDPGSALEALREGALVR
jgi:indole-3-glycerol phosphate synthase